MMFGKKDWFFADGYLPEKIKSGAMDAHEALMFFNPSSQEAEIVVNVYFSDREPLREIPFKVAAERVIAIRLDHSDELGGAVIPPQTQYALHIHSSIPIICQFGRLDTTQEAMAYYVGTPYAE